MRFKAMIVGMALAGGLMAAASPGALAQETGCRRDDVPCRLDRIDAEIAALQSKQSTIETRQAKIPLPAPPEPYVTVSTFEQCKTNCAEAAVALCKRKGFVDGKLKEWTHPKDGPMLLRSAVCKR